MKYTLYFLLFFTASIGMAQTNFNVWGTMVNIQENAELYVSGDFVAQDNTSGSNDTLATLRNTGFLIIDGDLINFSDSEMFLDEGIPGPIIFNGSVDQSIISSRAIYLPSIFMNKSGSSDLTLTLDTVRVDSTIQFNSATSGNIIIGDARVIMETNGLIVGERETSQIMIDSGYVQIEFPTLSGIELEIPHPTIPDSIIFSPPPGLEKENLFGIGWGITNPDEEPKGQDGGIGMQIFRGGEYDPDPSTQTQVANGNSALRSYRIEYFEPKSDTLDGLIFHYFDSDIASLGTIGQLAVYLSTDNGESWKKLSDPTLASNDSTNTITLNDVVIVGKDSVSTAANLLVLADADCDIDVMPSTDSFISSVDEIDVTNEIFEINICEGDSLGLDYVNAVDTEYTWWFGTELLAENDFFDIPMIADINQGIYKVRLRNTKGCETFRDIQVNVRGTPPANFGFESQTICVDEVITFVDSTATTEGDIVAYLWDFGDGTNQSILESPTHTYDAPGNYTVVMEVETEYGCYGTFSRLITVGANPLANFDVTNTKNGSSITTRCSGEGFFFDPDQAIFFVDGLQIPTLTWDFGDGNSQTFTPAGIIDPITAIETYGEVDYLYNEVTVDTEYKVTLTSISSFGCTVVDSTYVTVYAQPDNSFRMLEEGFEVFTSCIDREITFESNQAVIDESSYNYLWSFGDLAGTISNDPNPTFSYPESGTYNVQLTVSRASDPFCSVSSDQTITIADTPVSPYGNSVSSCGGSVLLDGDDNGLNTGSTFRWLNDAMVELSTNQTYTVNSATEDPIDIILEISNPSGCIVTQDIRVTLNTDLNVELGADILSCDPVIIGTNEFPSATFLWSTGETTATIEVNSTGTYSVDVTEPGTGCTSSDNIFVTIENPPVVDLGDDRQICEGELYTLNAGSHTTYLWSDGTTGPSIVAGSTGTYWVEVTNAFGCAARDSVDIQVNEDEITNPGEGTVSCESGCLGTVDGSFRMEMGLGPNTLCVGTVQFISAASEIDPSAYDYSWDFGDGTTSTEPAPLKTYSSDGTYSVSLSVTSILDGCNASSLDNFTVNPSPIIPVNGTITTCGGTVDLDAENVGSTYRWIDRNTLAELSTNQIYTVTSADEIPVLLTLEITNGFGCFSSRDITVNLNADINIDLGADFTTCETVTLGTTEFPSATFLWSTGETTPTIEVSSSGTFSVDVTEPGTGCTSSDEIQVTIENPPVVDLGDDRQICEGELYTLNAGSHTSYVWSDGTTGPSLVAGSTGTYWVEVSNVFGCTARDSIFVEVRNDEVTSPTGEIVSCDPGCVGTIDASFRMEMGIASNEACSFTEVQFISSASELDPTAYDFFWTFDDGDISIEPAPFKVFAEDGVYNVSLSVTSKVDGCNALSSDNVIVYATPRISLSESITTCGSSIELDAGNPGANYRWETTGTGVLLSTNQVYTVSSATDTPINITLEVSNGDGCEAARELSISLNSDLNIDLGEDFSACERAIIGTNDFPQASFLWSTGEITPTIEVTTSGTYSVQVTETEFGCVSSDEIIVTIEGNPQPDLGDDFTLCFNDVITLSPGAFSSYLWSNGSTGSTLDVGSPGSYWVEVTNAIGCVNRDTITVSLTDDERLELPDQLALCSSGGITLESPVIADSYQWNSSNGTTSTERSITVTETGTYWLEIQNDCIQRDTVEVVSSTDQLEPSFLIPSVVGVADFVNIVQLTDPLPERQVWAFGDGVFSTQANPIHQYGLVGEYEITLTIFNGGCTSSVTKNISVVESRFEEEVVKEKLIEILKLKTYPNPIIDEVNVELELSSESPILVSVFNLSGLEVYRKEFKEENLELPIDLSNQISGLYIIHVQVGKKMKLLKVIKPE